LSKRKELLDAYRAEALSLRAFEEHRSEITRCATPAGLLNARTASPGSRTNEPNAADLQLEEGLEAIVQRKREHLRRLQPEIYALLGQVSKPTTLQVLVCYYLQGMSNEETAEELHVAPRHVIRLRREFLAALDANPC